MLLENHLFDHPELTIKEQGVKREFVKIEDDCWIAANTVILAGWEQTNTGSLPSVNPYTRRNNAFLYELDLVTNTELNYSVFNNLNNEL